ncbi:MAG: hypothetical protein DRJ42_00105 [Deltaproteobacteria bacterium]|nr:MAG: hypothetical protein DRJ42_00105 [Deltaproteobacteria bacterium]
MMCPRCRGDLESLSEEDRVWGCRPCQGAFFDNAASQLLVANQLPELLQRSYAMAAERGQEEPQAKAEGGPFRAAATKEASCPVCQATMEPSTASGVEIDVCAEHGTWLDAGEAELIRKLYLFDAATATAGVAVAKDRRQAAVATEAEAFTKAVRARRDHTKGLAWALGQPRTLKDDIDVVVKLYRSLRSLFEKEE